MVFYILLFVVCIFIVLRFVVTLFNFISDPKLRRVIKMQEDLVSILIPARNEAHQILTLLESIVNQEYKNYEVIILDDDSDDDTYKLCADFAEQHPQFSVIKGRPLAEGWLGKNFACFQLAQQAKGKHLMFLDADEKISRGLINSAVYRLKANRLALLSLFTNQVMQTAGEKLTVPLMHYLLLNLLPIRLIYLSKNYAFAAASGQFMLFDAEIYRREQWHRQAKNRVVEDVEIMKQVKLAGYKGEGLLANGFIYCRMYSNYGEATRGFSKNFLAAFNYSVIGFLIYLIVIICGPLLILSTLNIPFIIMMYSLIILSRVMISMLSGQNVFINIVLHPLQMLTLGLIGVMAIQNHLTKNAVWKGRRIV
ncbi:hydroxychlorobactene glucosyltransferase CruC [Mucilaginibacter koreensis]